MPQPTPTPRQKSARKATATRKRNKISREYYEEYVVPAKAKIDSLLNLYAVGSRVKWAGRYGRRLKKGATLGTVLGFRFGGVYWKILVDGYKRPQEYHSGFWEIVK